MQQTALNSLASPTLPRSRQAPVASCGHPGSNRLQRSALAPSRLSLRQGAGGSSASSRRRASLRVQSVLDVTEATFESEVLKAEKPVVVDFWAHWCGPCKLISPIMDQLEKEYGETLKVVKVEADPCPKLVEQYKVYGLPAILLFKQGEVVPGGQLEGVIGKSKLLAWLSKLGISPAVPA